MVIISVPLRVARRFSLSEQDTRWSVMNRQQWRARFQLYLDAIQEEMRRSVPEKEPPLDPFYGMMAYHLGWRDESLRPIQGAAGKQIRPLLCLLACEVACERWRPALPAAAAVELLHNFTLIHDDIEDDVPLRRGRPAVWDLWGVPHAINVGDGLFVLARSALLRLREKGLPEGAVLEAVQILDRAILQICEGQYLDLAFEGHLDIDESDYLRMIDRKTAALLDAAVHLGTLIGGGKEETCAALRAYGRALGLAFQMQDDLLGVWGVEERTGKPAAADLWGRKLGLPTVHALAHASGEDRQALLRVYEGQQTVTEDDIAALLTALEGTASRSYVEQQAAVYHQQALSALAELPVGSAREGLYAITRTLLGRQE